ncbi:hypothetical protein D3C76_481190 [compost metagenome]
MPLAEQEPGIGLVVLHLEGHRAAMGHFRHVEWQDVQHSRVGENHHRDLGCIAPNPISKTDALQQDGRTPLRLTGHIA